MHITLLMRTATILTAALLATTAGATEVVESSGAENYVRFCAACHGADGRGDGPVADALINGAPDLTLIAQRRNGEFPRDIVRNTIDGRFRIEAHGTVSMPVWGYEFYVTEGAGNFSDDNVDAILDGIVDHLESIQN